MKSAKTKKILYWVFTAMIALIFLGSASGKLMANEETQKMAASFGIDTITIMRIGLLEITCLILFIIPRTGIFGSFLLAAYMGGAIATHLQHGLSIVAPCIIEALVFLVAFYRFPELRTRLMNEK
ncbi:MAG: DoxX family protein [Chitinophagia bacterium]|jgi:uncharacterized membrane protein YphA (DoxX/SURF4 family)